MVKGRNRRVVVVKSPDPKVFEQAIFIDGGFSGRAGKETDILKEAEKVADDYLKGAVTGARKRSQNSARRSLPRGRRLRGPAVLVLHLFGVCNGASLR